jgi:radical SAM/Cys-rich protein
MPMLSLAQRRHALGSAVVQRRLLDELALPVSFEAALGTSGLQPLRAIDLSILQVNLGKLCNQTCRHCHVDAGPDRSEVMPPDVVAACLAVLERGGIPTLDITGGAPELHPEFRTIVRRARARGLRVIDRCNLTILLVPAHADLPRFLADHEVEIVASLPSTNLKRTDAQRGQGVFERSIAALRLLNDAGYGRDPRLALDLVTNPVGAFLPGNQAALEADWKRELGRRYGIEFRRLLTLTNMPISRYLEFLVESGNLEDYMERLVNAYNPSAAAGVMCRTTLSVGWDGTLYDCDFNQMLEIPVEERAPRTIFDFDPAALGARRIAVGTHCFGCTAGAGSSCGGAIRTS